MRVGITLARSVSNNSSSVPEKFASRSQRRNPDVPELSSIEWFLACWVTSEESRCAVTPTTCTRRV
jgi:hypothetical protein